MKAMLYASVAVITIAGIAVAQQRPAQTQNQNQPAFVITEVQILDQAKFATYAPKVQQTIQSHEGHYLVRTGQENIKTVEGSSPQRLIITQFPSMQKAEAWVNSSEYKNLQPERSQSSKLIRQIIVPGCQQQSGSATMAGTAQGLGC